MTKEWNTYLGTKDILSVLKGGDPIALQGRNFFVKKDGYRSVFSSYEESSPFPVARMKEGVLEVPNQVTSNGFTKSNWYDSDWYVVPEDEFLLDYGKSYLKKKRTPMVVDHSSSF